MHRYVFPLPGVLELKVSRGADATVGQVLRYMGAVRADIAAGRPVLGVIVASTLTDKLKIAVAEVQDKVVAVEYEMQVALRRHT
jgi:endonuclease